MADKTLQQPARCQLSIVVPVFNESATIAKAIEILRTNLSDYSIEILIVDDGSTDGTTDQIKQLETLECIRVFAHPANRGKGAALRTAFENVRGEVIVIQDADLEYDPHDIPRLVKPIFAGEADVVYGSRFHDPTRQVHFFWHQIANRMLTSLSNMLNKLHLTDMETGYKAFSHRVIEKLVIRENRFGVEPELTAKIARLNCRVQEVPVSFHRRDYSAGKKIGFLDGLRAVWCIVRYRIAD